jgi:hypothetical protein
MAYFVDRVVICDAYREVVSPDEAEHIQIVAEFITVLSGAM